MTSTVTEQTTETWPSLPLSAWRETQETLHLWTQIVGKVKLALTPFLNEWWNVVFFVTPRGLTTGPTPSAAGIFTIDFDFIDHTLLVRASDGGIEAIPLVPRSVADVYTHLLGTLEAMGITVVINPMPVEIPDPISCDVDRVHASYDPACVQRWWRILVQTERILQRYRSPSWARAARSASTGGRSTSAPRDSPGERRRHPLAPRGSSNWPKIRRISPAAFGRGTPACRG